MIHSRYNAISRCEPFPLANLPQTLTVYSAHRQAINLCTPDDQWLALVTPQLGNGPFHLVVSPQALDALEVGASVRLDQTMLQFPDRTINFERARPWSSILPTKPDLQRDFVVQWLHANASSIHSPLWANDHSPLTQFARQGWATLQAGLLQSDAHQLAAGAARLAGLGPGLTPAGDDFLLGWLAGSWSGALGDSQMWTPRAIGEIVIESACPRTTQLSGLWLRHAAIGQFGEPWHRLIDALRQPADAPRQQAWQRLLRSGATSGHDALSGFCRAWGVV